MKILILFFSLLFISTSSSLNVSLNHSASAMSESTTYAKASVGCTLYKTQSLVDNISNIYFVVPETYFVIVLDTISDECVKVQYDKFVGFVKSDTIIIASFIPIVKTLDNITLDIKETSGTQIWSYPDTSSNILTTISAGAKNINYIASCYGTIPSGGDGNLWFYISYTPSKNSTNVYEGYIYSENTTNLSEIVANTETNPEIIDTNTDNENFLFVSSSFKTAVIIVITIPIIIFLLIMLSKSSKKYKEWSIKRKSEHFENENQINQTQAQHMHQNYNGQNLDEPTKTVNRLKSNLEQMKNMKFIKRTNIQENRPYPTFPDYNPDDDIL